MRQNQPSVAVPASVLDAATKAVYELQYNTSDAVRFIEARVPGHPEATYRASVSAVAKPSAVWKKQH